MEPTRHTIIELGIKLLNERKVDISAFTEAFSLAGVKAKELKIAPLKSVFGGEKYFEPKELSSFDINYPIRDSINDFDKVTFNVSGNSLSLLERYGTFVATDADDTIPVYDLFKTVAAIQDCLDKGEKDKPFLLVSADFSGIQDTVYTISSKGALKTLRARSFMLELLTEHIIYEILQATSSGRYDIIYSGGGGFSLLLPNDSETSGKIEKYRDILNIWALKEFSGKFYIALDALAFDLKNNDLKDARDKQYERLEKLKQCKFLTHLDVLLKPKMPKQLTSKSECQITHRDDLPPSQMFALPDDKVRSGQIVSMQRISVNNRDQYTWTSESCFRQFYLGDALIGANKIYRYARRPKFSNKNGVVTYLRFPNFKHGEAYYGVESFNNPTPEKIFVLNLWENDFPTFLYTDYVRTIGDLPKAIQAVEKKTAEAENRPFKYEHTATFEGLAASSCGADLIGALRMDVDNMGSLFRSILTLTELSAKSRMLNLFFKVYLKQICTANLGGGLTPTDIVGKNYSEKNGHGDIGRNVSIVYAGGDDLFVIGAWDETTELAFDIQRCFALFTGGIYDTTKKIVTGGHGISGGLTMHQPRFPLYQMGRKSGEAESVSKHAKVQKNCFTPFLLSLDDIDKGYEFYNNKTVRIIDWYDPIFFGLLENLVALTEKQLTEDKIDIIKLDAISRGFIYKLFEVAKVWVAEGSLYLPRLRYIFSRLEKQYTENKDAHQQAGIQSLRSVLFSQKHHEREKYIKSMTLTLNWFDHLQRNK